MTTRPIQSTTRSKTHDSNGTLLPGLICLHGSGSNSTVFKLQCRRLLWLLGTHFRFFFVEAPHTGQPGYGMLPVFESCAPFYRWVTGKYAAGEPIEVPTAQEVKQIDDVLRKAMEENGGVDSFVGIVGFSQGARVSVGQLLRQKMAERDGRECWTKYQFGVLIGGPYPPIVMDGEGGDVVVDVRRDYELMRDVPTVHAWGIEDVYGSEAALLADMCDGDVSRQFQFAGGHHLPLNDGDAKVLCDCILETWKAAGGKPEVSV